MKILVCGDRNWWDYGLLSATLDKICLGMPDEYPSTFITIIEGCAAGADTMGGVYAAAWHLGLEEYPANWKKYGKGAGHIRNQQMLDEGKPDLVLAFHDRLDLSKGTADMVRRAKKAGIEVRNITH